MVAAGDEVDAGRVQFFGGWDGQPKSARGILTICDAQVRAMLLASKRQTAFERLTPR